MYSFEQQRDLRFHSASKVDYWETPVSIGWVALSSLVVVRSSRIGNISSSLHSMVFLTIHIYIFSIRIWFSNSSNYRMKKMITMMVTITMFPFSLMSCLRCLLIITVCVISQCHHPFQSLFPSIKSEVYHFLSHPLNLFLRCEFISLRKFE